MKESLFLLTLLHDEKLTYHLLLLVCSSVWGQQDTTFLYMDSLFQQLPEVLVRGERPVIKAERGKLIYDVPRIIEKLPVTNAYEVLKELPGVTEKTEP